MNKNFLPLLWVVLLCVSAPAIAAIPATVNYQGYVTDSGGSPVDGVTNITFSAYNTDTGGAPLWTDTQSVSITQGLFSVELGSTPNPLPAGLFDTPIWIGVAVDTDGEMTPRRALTSAAFAFESDNALNLQGQAASVFDQSAHVIDTSNPHGVSAAQTNAASASEIVALQGQINTLLAAITSLQAGQMATDIAVIDNALSVSTLQTDVTTVSANVTINSAAVTTNSATISTETASRISADATQDTTIGAIQNNSVLALDNILSVSGDNAVFTGVNLQVTNGLGISDSVNGKGNLIVGYDEVTTSLVPTCSLGTFIDQATCESNLGTWAISHKSGSHNIVAGTEHNYSRSGGLVIGGSNTISGNGASVSGGYLNTASGDGSSVSGGIGNDARSNVSSVSGGSNNEAQGAAASVSGGLFNNAVGPNSSVSGGLNNEAQGAYSSVSGGNLITVTADNGSVATNVQAALVIEADARIAADAIHDSALSSIQANSVLALDNILSLSGNSAVFSGVNVQVVNGLGITDTFNGTGNFIVGYDEIRSVGDQNCSLGEFSDQATCESNLGTWAISHKSGSHNIVVGREHNYSRHGGLVAGFRNTISGNYASVSGGRENTASTNSSSVSGGFSNIASGEISSVSGGSDNSAQGIRSSISGGFNNTASGNFSSVSGGEQNEALGLRSSVSGGQQNVAQGTLSSVSGGVLNIASGTRGSVSGGQANVAQSESSSISGGVLNIASGTWGSVSGGRENVAQSEASSVSGGLVNNAQGVNSSVSGGTFITVTEVNGWEATNVQAALSLIQANSVLALDNILSLSGSSAVFTGVNVQIVNGLGGTQTVNGTGNLLVGYDEIRNFGDQICSIGGWIDQATCESNAGTWAISHKSGSHNVVVGNRNNYSRYGGLVTGEDNTISGNYASVSAGIENTASGRASSVSGGSKNEARSSLSSVSGGIFNTASGGWSSVSGGRDNVAEGSVSSVSGGNNNTASNSWSSVSGGRDNVAQSLAASVSGGSDNVAQGVNSSVSGGTFRTALGEDDWVAGSLFEDN